MHLARNSWCSRITISDYWLQQLLIFICLLHCLSSEGVRVIMYKLYYLLCYLAHIVQLCVVCKQWSKTESSWCSTQVSVVGKIFWRRSWTSHSKRNRLDGTWVFCYLIVSLRPCCLVLRATGFNCVDRRQTSWPENIAMSGEFCCILQYMSAV